MRDVNENMHLRSRTICNPESRINLRISACGIPLSLGVSMRRGRSQFPIEWLGSQISCQPEGFVQRAISRTTMETLGIWCRTPKQVTRSNELSAKGMRPLGFGVTYSNRGFWKPPAGSKTVTLLA